MKVRCTGKIVFVSSDSTASSLKNTFRFPKLIDMLLVDIKSDPIMHCSASLLMTSKVQTVVLPLTVMGACSAPNTFKLFPWTSQMWQSVGSSLIPDSMICLPLSASIAVCVAPLSNRAVHVVDPTLIFMIGRGSLRM